MGYLFTIVAVLVGNYFISRNATGRILMGLSEQNAALKAAETNVKTAISGVSERISTKLDELTAKLEAAGEPDPDLTETIDALRADAAALDAIGAAPATTETVVPDTGEASPGGFVTEAPAETSDESVATGEEVAADESAATDETGGGE